MSGNEAPVTVNWSTVFAFLALLFAGFAAWQAMHARVIVLEANMAPDLREQLSALKSQNSEILRRLEQIEARASGSPPA
jgi:hypothetical protein